MTSLNPIGTALQTAAATPSNSSSASKASTKLAGDFDTFLTLLTEQLKNQDPTNPMDTETFVSQLVQFSSVEQLINASASLDKILTLQTATTRMSATDYIGREVTISSDKTNLSNKSARWDYELSQSAKSVQLNIYDNAGRLIATKTGETDTGTNTLTWDGKDNNGKQVSDGLYRLSVKALDNDGKPISSKISVTGKATAITMSGNSVFVDVNGLQVPAGQIIGVRQAS